MMRIVPMTLAKHLFPRNSLRFSSTANIKIRHNGRSKHRHTSLDGIHPIYPQCGTHPSRNTLSGSFWPASCDADRILPHDVLPPYCRCSAGNIWRSQHSTTHKFCELGYQLDCVQQQTRFYGHRGNDVFVCVYFRHNMFVLPKGASLGKY